MKKILTILGARPQFIKASVISHEIRELGAFQEIIVHTGQHFDAKMSEVFFHELSIPVPDYSLGINGGTHGSMTARMLEGIEKILLKENPHAVMVYGDTNSTLAGALAAVKLHLPVAHVEAGLRSFNMEMPEEVNRILTDNVSRWLFTPTEAATQNLEREGFKSERIFPVGDVMYDVALRYGQRIKNDTGLMAKLGLVSRGYILATVHRAENTNQHERLSAIVDALVETSRDMPVVWPLHPRTRSVLQQIHRLDTLVSSVLVIDPVGYEDMMQLEKYAALIATDSGGVQKEAFFHGVPCVTLRHETEWVELVAAGWNCLVPPSDASTIRAAIRSTFGSKGENIQPYGIGDAAKRIVSKLSEF